MFLNYVATIRGRRLFFGISRIAISSSLIFDCIIHTTLKNLDHRVFVFFGGGGGLFNLTAEKA